MGSVLSIEDPKFIALVEKGISLYDLEKRLRPRQTSDWEQDAVLHAGFGDVSQEGFLGNGEDLLTLVHSDWETIDRYGTTHAAIVERMGALMEIGEIERERAYDQQRSLLYRLLPRWIGRRLDFRYDELETSQNARLFLRKDYRFKLPFVFTMGEQSCPWGCGYSGQNAGVIHVQNLTHEQELEVQFAQMGGVAHHEKSLREMASRRKDSDLGILLTLADKPAPLDRQPFYAPLTGLLPHLIRDHYFFEGRKTPYRADPAFLIEAFGLSKQP